MFHEQSEAESIMSQVLIISRSDRTKYIPHLNVSGHLVNDHLKNSITVFQVLLLVNCHQNKVVKTGFPVQERLRGVA